MVKTECLSGALYAFRERVGLQRTIRVCLMSILFICGMLLTRTARAQITVDGNPADWPAVFANPAIQFKVHVVDQFNTSTDDVYQGSSADNIDIIPGWEWHLQSANDKTDIENAGAALIGHKVYFFGDRYSDGGTAAMSFWLFKNSVHKKTPPPNGFTAAHADGDLLVSVNFDGGGGVANRVIRVWQSGALVTPPGLGIGAANVAVNSSAVLAPWPYTPKSNSTPANWYASESFVEAFVDLDSVAAALGLSLDSCFADFFISTRTSHTLSATLEDLATGLFGSAPDVTVANDTVCFGQSAVFTAITLGGARPIQWSWNDTVSYGSDSTYTINPAVHDTFVTVIARGSNGCRSGIDTGFLRVRPAPVVDSIPSRVHCNRDVGSAITFSSTPPGATFSWTSSANVGFGTSGTGSIGTYTATNNTSTPVVATVTVTGTGLGCTGPGRTFNVTVNPTPNVAAHGDSTYCNGFNAPGFAFSGNVGGTTFKWTSTANVGFGTSGTGNIGPFTANNTGTVAVTATVIVTDTANGCGGVRDTFLVTVNPSPNVAAHGDSTYCNGAAAGGLTFTGGVGGTSFAWTSSANVGFGTSGTGNIGGYTATNNGTTAITTTVIVTPSANGCTGVADTFLITVNPTPNVVAHGDSTYCNGDAAGGLTFTGGVGGTAFAWTSSANVGFGTSGTGNIGGYTATNNGTTAITTTVIVTPSANGCTGVADTFLITVNPTPNVVAHGDSTYCNGDAAGSLSFTGGVGGTTFAWTSSANVGFGTSGTGNIGGYTATNNGTTAITTTVVVTPSANGCTGVADTFLITVNPTPNVAAHGDSTYCNGQPAGALTFTGGVGGTTFAWTSTTDVGFGTAGTGNIAAYVASNPTLVQVVATVVVTPSANGCTGTPDTFLITVNPNPTVDPIPNRVHCNGDTAAAINFTGGVSGATFAWSTTANVGFGTSGTGNIPSYIATNTGVTTVSVVVTVSPTSTGCPGAIATFNVTVNPTPNVVAHGDSTYCNGAAAGGLSFTGGVGGTAFAWTSSANVGFGTSGTGSIGGYTATNNGTTAITTTVIVTPSANGCTGVADTFLITVNPTPNVVAHGDSIYCNGDAAGGLSFTGGVGGTTFAWTSSANVGFGTSGTGNIGSYTATNNGAAQITATVIVTPSANGCTGVADTFLIRVNPTPNVAAHGDSTYCNGQPAGALTFTGGVGGTTFAWTSTTNVGFGTAGTGNITAYVASNPTLVQVVATVVVTPSANGCTGTPDTFLITVNPNPTLDPVPNRVHCNGDAATAIHFMGGVSGASFTWTSNINVGFGTSGADSIAAYVALNAGTTPAVATVTVTPTATGCPGAISTFMVTVNPTPNVVAHGDSTYCAGASAPGLNFTGGVSGTSFTWSASPNAGFGTSGTGNIPSYTATNGGLVALVSTVIVTPSANGCTGRPDTFLITVNPNPSIDPVPNRLHCNGDPGTAINFSGSIGGITFSWVSSTNVGFGTSGTGNIGAYVAANAGSTPVVATVTVTPSVTSCGGGAITFMVTVNPTPNVVAHGDSSYCKGVTAPGLNFTGSVSGTAFAWTSSANVGFGTSGTGNIPPYLTLNPGSTNLVATVIVTPSKDGCTGVKDTFLITIRPKPSIPPISNVTVCSGGSAGLINITGGDVVNIFTWTGTSNVGFGTTGTGNIAGYTAINNPGPLNIVDTVTVSVTSTSGCTGDNVTFTVTVLPNLVVTARDTTICGGGSLNLIPLGNPAGGTWSGPGVSGSTFNSGGLSAGTYTVYYTVSSGGCTGYDSAYITLTECCVVYGTYTQGVYGSCYGTVKDSHLITRTPTQLINYLLSLGGPITVGRPGRSVVIPITAAAIVNAVLPGGYGPNQLTYGGNVTISNSIGSIFRNNYISGGKLNNSLLGQQIAMKLNIRMSPGLVNFPIIYTPGDDSYFQTFTAAANCCHFDCDDMCPSCFSIKKKVAKYLTKGGTQAATLADLLDLADDLLGGILTPGTNVGGYIVPSYSDVENVLSTISSAFNYFRTFYGTYGCTAGKGAIAISNNMSGMPSLESQTRIYPNPTRGAFTIEVPAIEKDAHVTVMDMNGRTIMSATAPAKPTEQKVQLEMPDVSRGIYFIRVEVGGNLFVRKLLLE